MGVFGFSSLSKQGFRGIFSLNQSLKREWQTSFRKRLSSIHICIGLGTWHGVASCYSDWETVGTSRETYTHTYTDTMEYKNTKHETGKQSSHKQSHKHKVGNRRTSHNTHIYFLVHDCTHTLLAGFSVFLAAGSGCSCLPFLDGVLLILGEWNLSISFMVKEDRWDRCESTRTLKQKVDWSSCGEEKFSGAVDIRLQTAQAVQEH